MMRWLTPWRRWPMTARTVRAHSRRLKTRLTLESFEARDLLDSIPIIPNLPTTFLSPSTVPFNGDLNPYGVAFVPNGFPSAGPLHVGDILVSNFNNQNNLQGPAPRLSLSRLPVSSTSSSRVPRHPAPSD
jgi:hypothetical protein